MAPPTAPDMVFADSSLAKSYATYRPQPPDALVQKVVSYWKTGCETDISSAPPAKSVLVDVGCGSGQSSHLFAPHFDTVVGVDVSPQQLTEARQQYKNLPNISFVEGGAENLPFEPATVDVVTVCSAAHWFDLKTFYKEVDKVLRPGGVLAVYSYTNSYPLYNNICLRSIMVELYGGLGCETPERNHLYTEYSSLPAAYEGGVHISSADGGFETSKTINFSELMGYISSWSALAKYRKLHGEEAGQLYINQGREKLLSKMGTTEQNPSLTIRFRYFMRLCRKPFL